MENQAPILKLLNRLNVALKSATLLAYQQIWPLYYGEIKFIVKSTARRRFISYILTAVMFAFCTLRLIILGIVLLIGTDIPA